MNKCKVAGNFESLIYDTVYRGADVMGEAAIADFSESTVAKAIATAHELRLLTLEYAYWLKDTIADQYSIPRHEILVENIWNGVYKDEIEEILHES